MLIGLAFLACASCPRSLRAQQRPGCPQDQALLQEIVLDADTRMPLRGTSVEVSWRDGTNEHVITQTDSLGRAYACVPAGEAATIQASYFRHSASSRNVIVAAPITRHVTNLDVPSFLVRGSVADLENGTPLVNAAVRIRATSLAALSDAEGRFYFPRVPMGDYDMTVEMFSYAVNRVRLSVRDEDLDVAVKLAPQAIAIAPINVTTFSRTLERVGFYERQKKGLGTFITRKQIENSHATETEDLVRAIPGLRQTEIFIRRRPKNITTGRNNCAYRFVIDGARTMPDFEIDNVPPYAIEGIEVYSGIAEIPAVFRPVVESGGQACGAIVIWTKAGR